MTSRAPTDIEFTAEEDLFTKITMFHPFERWNKMIAKRVPRTNGRGDVVPGFGYTVYRRWGKRETAEYNINALQIDQQENPAKDNCIIIMQTPDATVRSRHSKKTDGAGHTANTFPEHSHRSWICFWN